MDQARIDKIRSWNKKLSYKIDSMPGRILKYLDENKDSRYIDLRKNEAWNYTRNLRSLERSECSCESAIFHRNQSMEKWTKEYFEKQICRLAIHKYSDGTEQLIWTTYLETNSFVERFLTYEEHIEDFKEGINQVQRELDKIQLKIEEVKKTPGKFFEGNWGPEPNFGQIISIMLVDRTIKRVKRGIYRITATGKKQLKKGRK